MTSTASMIYVELPAPNLQAAADFYATVFGWTITVSTLSDQAYWTFGAEAGLAGALDPSKQPSADGVLIYLKVESIPTTLSAIAAAGGCTVRDEEPIGGDHGLSAVFADPNGNHLGLWAPSTSSPGA